MKPMIISCILTAAMSFAFCQDGGNGVAKKFEVRITAEKALSYESPDKRGITELTKTSVVVRRNSGDEKAKGTVVRADHAKTESKADGTLERITFSGNIQIEGVDGTVIQATEAVINLAEESLIFKAALR